MIGEFGPGIFIQTGGTNSPSTITIASDGGINGTSVLSDGTLDFNGQMVVGSHGNGTFNQSGGTASVSTMKIAISPGSHGAANFSGGTFSSQSIVVGQSGTGVMTLSGNADLSLSGNLQVGLANSGTVTQSAGAATVFGILELGVNSGAGGAYIMSGGTLSLFNEIIGSAGSGTFTQSGGTVSIFNNNLDIANSITGSGNYQLIGGTFLTTNAYIGGNSGASGGAGVFNIQGGSATVTGAMKIWNTPGTLVTLAGSTLAAGTLDTSGQPLRASTGPAARSPSRTRRRSTSILPVLSAHFLAWAPGNCSMHPAT